VRNPIYLAAMTIFVGQALLFGQLSLLLYTIAVWVGAAAFVRFSQATKFRFDVAGG
jgi:protein-S-isoprenylcysteine O-methyltransferase Ste14